MFSGDQVAYNLAAAFHVRDRQACVYVCTTSERSTNPAYLPLTLPSVSLSTVSLQISTEYPLIADHVHLWVFDQPTALDGAPRDQAVCARGRGRKQHNASQHGAANNAQPDDTSAIRKSVARDIILVRQREQHGDCCARGARKDAGGFERGNDPGHGSGAVTSRTGGPQSLGTTSPTRCAADASENRFRPRNRWAGGGQKRGSAFHSRHAVL